MHLRVQEDTESMFFTHDELAAVDTAIETLKHDYKEPMRLLRMGYSSREIAEILHLTEGCCKMRIARARQCLRELVGREENRGRR